MRHSELNNFLDHMTDDSGGGRSEGHRHICPRAIKTAVVRGCGGTLQSEPRICKQRSYAGRCRVGGLSPEEGRFHLFVEEPEGCSGGITPDAVDAAHSSPDAASPRHPRVFVKTGGLRRLIAV